MKQTLLVLLLLTSFAQAMDWDTASEIAVCRNHRGYEKLANRLVAILDVHRISSMIMYFEKSEAITEDYRHAHRWGLFVNVNNADEARKILLSESSKEIRAVVVPPPAHQSSTEAKK